MSMGDRKDGHPIQQAGDTGEVGRTAARPNPKEPSRSRIYYDSTESGKKHGGTFLRQGQALKDAEREKSPNTLEQLELKSIESPSRIDPEVARYASNVKIQISKAENKRLRKMIDSRVLVVMVVVSWTDSVYLSSIRLTLLHTYFIQALDKGAMGFVSIMHMREDLHLKGQEVFFSPHCSEKLSD
jgi:hypothetical protein